MNNKFKATAIHDRVIILPYAKEEKTKGGLIIADSIEQSVTKGVVVSIGEKVRSVKEGDHIMFDAPRCGVIVLNDVMYYVARDKDNGDGQIDLILDSH